MPERVKSNAVNNSIRFTSISLTKLTKAQLIDFANKICKVNNYSYLCDATELRYAVRKNIFDVIIKRRPCLTSTLRSCGSVARIRGRRLFLLVTNF